MKNVFKFSNSHLISLSKTLCLAKSKTAFAARRSLLLLLAVLLSLASFAQVNLNEGLVAYYPFNGNANDESGNDFNATTVENVSWEGSSVLVSDSSLVEFSSDIIAGHEATYYLDVNIEDVYQDYYYGVNFWVNAGTLPVFDDETGTLIYTDTWWDNHGLDLDINQDGNDYHLPDTYMSPDNSVSADRFWNIPFETGFSLHDFDLWTSYFKWGSFSNCGGWCSYNPHGVRAIWSSSTYYDFDYSDYGTYKGFLYGYFFPTFQAAPVFDIKGTLAVMADTDSLYLYFGHYSQKLASFPYSNGQNKLIIKVSNSNELSVYSNGDLIGIYTTPWDFQLSNWSSTVVLGGGFEGSVDELRVYNRALNEEEVMELAGASAALGQITNVTAAQRTDGSKILDVTYDLSGSEAEYDVSLEVSFDAGSNYQQVNQVSGDVGMVAPGDSLVINWDAGNEFPEGFVSYTMKVMVLAEGQGGGTFTCGDDFTDARDGQTYSTVLIGEQCWMAENLAYLPEVSPSAEGSTTDPHYYVYGYQGSDVAEAKARTNYETYGALYNWPASIDACPDGWHLPADAEWTGLTNYIRSRPEYLCNSNTSYIGKALAATTSWNTNPGICTIGNNLSANNTTGFTGLPGGYRNTYGSFDFRIRNGFWWSSSQSDTSNAWSRDLYSHGPDVYRNYYGKSSGLAVRCVKAIEQTNLPPTTLANPNPENEATGQLIESTLSWTCTDPENDPLTYDVFFGTEATPAQVATGQSETTFNPGTLDYNTQYFWKIVAHDDQGNTTEGEVWSFSTGEEPTCGDDFTDARDGQTYSTVQIGDQCWMAENLNIGERIDGTVEMIDNGTIEKYCYFDNEAKCDIYGGLYQWNEMMGYVTTEGVQGICPDGWHLPADAEWTILTTYLGGDNVAGGKMKETGTAHWNSPNTDATNSSGFTGLPGGIRNTNGTFNYLGSIGFFWSSTEYSSSNAWYRTLYYNSANVPRTNDAKGYGFSVRCVRD